MMLERKKEKTDDKKVLACPVCGGKLTSWMGFSMGLIYFCKKCGYRGPVALKTSKNDAEKLEKKYDEKKEER